MEQSYGGAVQEGCIDEPGAHHPAQVGWEGHHVPLPDVHLGPGIKAAPDRGCVGPWYCFRVPCETLGSLH